MARIIEKKKARGIITRKNNTTVWVQLIDDCTTEDSCHGGCAGCSGKKSSRTIIVHPEDAAPYQNGSCLFVEFVTINELVGALVVFGIPLGFALATLFFWYIFSPQQAESGMAILSAGAAFAAGFLPVRLIDGIFRKRFPSKVCSTQQAHH